VRLRAVLSDRIRCHIVKFTLLARRELAGMGCSRER
jgi:hypothetical protein